jgi:hypothetical protein
MKIYRVFDKTTREFVKIGKRTNDLYKSKPLVISALKKYYKIDDVSSRFDVVEYDLVRTNNKIR